MLYLAPHCYLLTVGDW